ncbi:MAG: peptide deformylase [Coxiellaceae bacterium]|jgi:peptide deformylase|nr:peptide deformylase [Coxiellaceae bacterium]
MTILNILQYPDIRLRRKGCQVTNVSAPKIQEIINNMLETLIAKKNCAGLAATQLELDNPPNIAVINYTQNEIKKNILCLVNPQIIIKEGSNLSEEGCMSIGPSGKIYAKIRRATKIQVQALDSKGRELKFEAADFLARCIQHECDHLQGILFIDYLSKLKWIFIERKIIKFTNIK